MGQSFIIRAEKVLETNPQKTSELNKNGLQRYYSITNHRHFSAMVGRLDVVYWNLGHRTRYVLVIYGRLALKNENFTVEIFGEKFYGMSSG